VDEEKFNPRASKPVEIPLPPGKNVLLFYHGSIAWNRGMPELLSAFAGAQKDRENLCLVVLGGSDAEREELARRFRRHGGKKGLLVLPPVENSEVPGYLAAADAGVCPLPDSWKWAVSSPLKVLEYAAMEKPVLATDIEAHRVIFEGSGAAVLAEKGTPEALRAAILKMVSNLDEMKEKAKASRSKILARYSWTAQARNLEIFLDALGPTHFQRSFAATRKSIGPIFPAIAGEEKSSSQD
jgi:glycosyltransferase involved in cell wall biosynthesis